MFYYNFYYMATPRKKKPSRVDQKQKNEYSSILGDTLHLVEQKDLTAREKRSSNAQDNNFLAGGRRSTDRENAGLSTYWESLTEREQDVMILLCQGLGDAEIAAQLIISVATVKSHIQRIFLKVNVRNRKQIMVRFRNFNFPREIPTIHRSKASS